MLEIDTFVTGILVKKGPPDLDALSKKDQKIKTSVLLDPDVHAFFSIGGAIGQKINALCRWYMNAKLEEEAGKAPKKD